MNKFLAIVLLALLILLSPRAAFTADSYSFEPRAYYEARLEPVAQVLHGAGQSPSAFAHYFKGMEGSVPVLYMTYVDVKDLSTKWVDHLSRRLARYPEVYLIPQLGLSMTTDGKPERHYEHDVAAGLYDDTLNRSFAALAKLDRPMYIRIGYEGNGPWNGYKPLSYKKAFIHLTRMIRKHKLNAATVWSVYPLNLEQARPYYPGDQWVDWWGISIFDPHHMNAAKPLLNAAHKHRKPVMISESTPRYVGVAEGYQSWEEWFDPYFKLILTQPGIKAFCYINWNWSEYPRWKNWGDARLEINQEMTELYKQQLASPLFFHGSNRQDFLNSLHKALK